jgi:hypothetical protein
MGEINLRLLTDPRSWKDARIYRAPASQCLSHRSSLGKNHCICNSKLYGTITDRLYIWVRFSWLIKMRGLMEYFFPSAKNSLNIEYHCLAFHETPALKSRGKEVVLCRRKHRGLGPLKLYILLGGRRRTNDNNEINRSKKLGLLSAALVIGLSVGWSPKGPRFS